MVTFTLYCLNFNSLPNRPLFLSFSCTFCTQVQCTSCWENYCYSGSLTFRLSDHCFVRNNYRYRFVIKLSSSANIKLMIELQHLWGNWRAYWKWRPSLLNLPYQITLVIKLPMQFPPVILLLAVSTSRAKVTKDLLFI